MIFLDFEASGLNGYPIEVGLAIVQSDRSIVTVGRLIRHDEWLDQVDMWDHTAEALHRIRRADLLEHGRPPTEVCAWLDELLGDQVACIDSPYDRMWLSDLFSAAFGRGAVAPVLADIGAAFGGGTRPYLRGKEIDEVRIEKALRAKATAKIEHRAEADASAWAEVYVASLRDNAPVHRLFMTNTGIERRALP